jgi:hypothetical protein
MRPASEYRTGYCTIAYHLACPSLKICQGILAQARTASFSAILAVAIDRIVFPKRSVRTHRIIIVHEKDKSRIAELLTQYWQYLSRQAFEIVEMKYVVRTVHTNETDHCIRNGSVR